MTDSSTNQTNQRVTNAVLKKDIENLSKRVGEMNDELRADKESTTKRLKLVESHVIKCATLWEKHDTEHARVNEELRDVKGDVRKWSSVTGTAGGIFAVIASIFLDR